MLSVNASAEAWSLDGKGFAYATTEGIWTIKVPLFDHPHLIAREPASNGIIWSPDGRELAFIGAHSGERGDTIWLVREDGSGLKDLLPAGGSSSQPGPQRRSLALESWLPNNGIAFSMGVGTGFIEHLLVDPDSGSIRELCTSRGPIFWSPQNSTAVVQNDESAGATPAGLGLLRISDALQSPDHDRECSTLIESFILPGRQLIASFNAWSPDGSEVMFTRNSDVGGTSMPDLYLWDIGRGSIREIMENASDGKWSPDEKFLAAVVHGKPYYSLDGALRSGSRPYAGSKLFIVGWPKSTVSGSLKISRDVLGFNWSNRCHCLAITEPTNVVLVKFANKAWQTESILKPFRTTFGSELPWSVEWSPDGEWLMLSSGWLQGVLSPTIYILRMPRDRSQ